MSGAHDQWLDQDRYWDLPWSERVEGRGDRGAFLAPDECRTCWVKSDRLTRNCTDHAQLIDACQISRCRAPAVDGVLCQDRLDQQQAAHDSM